MIKCVVFLLFISCFVSSELNETWLYNVRTRRQSDSKNCILPPYPKNGQYTVGGQPRAQPGERYDAVQLYISCDPGYQPLGTNTTLCVFGEWSQDMPQCVRHCRLDSNPSVRYRCLVNSDDSEDVYYRNCEQHEPSGTIVKPECNEPNYYFGGVLSHMRCIGGGWNYVASCLPECGIITPNGNPLIIGGQVVQRGEFPWHAGIYLKTTMPTPPFQLICGGSLVSSTVVVSAAHCFWSQSQPRPASDFAIALGKFYREWNNPLDDDVQKYDVVEVKIPVRYQNAATNYQDDIAVAILSAPAQYRSHVRPVCLNWDPVFNAHQLHDGNLGKVAGWGLIDAEGTPSRVLKVLELPYVRIETCILEAPSDFRPFITSDKICAGYQNGSTVCRGDSGGGLVFPEVERAKERYYLRGIVSTAPQSDQECNAFARTTFTQITKHQVFIEKYTSILVDRLALVEKDPDPLCTLPPYPANGRYQLSGSPGALPGQTFLSAQLEVTCNEGYTLEKEASPSCSLGRWYEDMPKCIIDSKGSCTIPSNLNVSIECGEKFFTSRSCKDVEPNETLITVDCRNIEIGNITTSNMKIVQCESGKLDGDLNCDDSRNCGLVKHSSHPTPWVAMIYMRKAYHCGATIISRFVVVTAAECIRPRSPVKRIDFDVVTGTTYWQLDDDEFNDNSYKQVSKIRAVRIFKQENGKAQNNDVTLVGLSTPIQFNDRVQPACWPNPFNIFDSSILRNSLGKVTTWIHGLTQMDVDFVEAGSCTTVKGDRFPENISFFRTTSNSSIGRDNRGMGLVYEVEGHHIFAGYLAVFNTNSSCSEYMQLAIIKLLSAT